MARFHHDNRCNGQQQEAIGVRRERLVPPVTIRPGRTRGSPADTDRDDRQDQRAAIRHHVGCFSQQGYGVGPEAADAFHDCEAAEHHERNPQSPLARVFSPVMVVVMIMAVASATVIVAGAAMVMFCGLRTRRSGWVICLSRHVIFPSAAQGRFGAR